MQKLNAKQLQSWIDEEPLEEHIVTLNNGARLIPYEFIEQYLDTLSVSLGIAWGTQNYNRVFTILNGNESIDASIELVVPSPIGQRTVVGTATYSLLFIREGIGASVKQITGDINEHYSATAKSLAIVNAAKHLGRKFGKYLNQAIVDTHIDELENKYLGTIPKETAKIDGILTVVQLSQNRKAAEKCFNYIGLTPEYVNRIKEAIDKKFPIETLA